MKTIFFYYLDTTRKPRPGEMDGKGMQDIELLVYLWNTLHKQVKEVNKDWIKFEWNWSYNSKCL